jgi:phosphatidylserine decarboxylase
VVNPPRPKQPRGWKYDETTIELGQGEEMGRFLLGSTVILLFPQQSVEFSQDWHAGKSVRMGEAMAARPPQNQPA